MPVVSGLLSSRANTADPDQELVGFKDDPEGRGTIGLIWSCLLTLALCVWSALHLNIPPKYDTPVRQWSRMLRWVFLGILAPELVLWAAWRQWQSAKILTVRVQEILNEQDEQQQQETVCTVGQDQDDKLRRQSTAKTGRKYEWTRLHSFYACMGGLVFDMAESTEDGIDHIPRYRRVTLSAHATILLARCGHLPDIDPDYIKDKSKADSLAKVIVLLQATWFLVQAIARLVFHLPVSLLEVNTIGHVLCALVMYLLWWNKPREVREPTVLHGDWVKPLCSFMFMSSRISGIQYQSMIRQHPSAWVFPELENLTYVAPDCPAPPAPGASSSSTEKKTDEINDYPRSSTTAVQDHARRIDTADSLADHGADSDWGGFRPEIRRQDTAHTLARKRKLGWELNETAAELQAKRLERHTLCAQAFQTYPAVREYFTRKGPESAEYVPRLEQFLLPIATNWPGDYLLEPNTKSVVGIVLWFVSIMYGSVHLAAWKEYFPTDAERLIWHMSAGYIAASGVYWCIAHVLFYMWPWLADWWGRFVHLKNHWLQYVVYGFLMACAGTLYILTRAYLTIEGLVSLRSVPKSMYETVEWEDYIPHF